MREIPTKIMPTIRINITIPKELNKKLKKRKEELGIPVSTQIRLALEKEFKKK